MLQRTQLMLDQELKISLAKIAKDTNRSLSHVARTLMRNELEKTKNTRQKTALMRWTENAVNGPGNSDYDTYAYEI